MTNNTAFDIRNPAPADDGHKLDNGVNNVPTEIDQEVTRLKLPAMNMGIDELTGEQLRYLSSRREGT